MAYEIIKTVELLGVAVGIWEGFDLYAAAVSKHLHRKQRSSHYSPAGALEAAERWYRTFSRGKVLPITARTLGNEVAQRKAALHGPY